MEKNEGKADRITRFIIGVVAIYFGIKFSAWWYLLALVAIITSLTGYCKLYSLFGWNTTCKMEESKIESFAKKVSKKKKL